MHATATSAEPFQQLDELARVDPREAFRRSTRLVQTVLDSSQDGFIVLDRLLRVAYVNRSARDLLKPVTSSQLAVLGAEWPVAFPGLSETPVGDVIRDAAAQGIATERELMVEPLCRWLLVRATPSDEGMTVLVQDVTVRKQAELRLEAERKVLEAIANRAPLAEVLELIAAEIERQSVDGVLCSILLLDEDGKRLLHGAAPSLPDEYNAAIHGIEIGPGVGSCGTAAFERRPVWVSDIATDPLWKDFKDLATDHGLRACCSNPMFAVDGTVLGTIAMYYGRPWTPSASDSRIIELAARLAGIAIDRQRDEQALRRSEQFNRGVVESSRDCIKTLDLDGTLTWISERGRQALCVDDSSQLVGRSYIEFWDGEYREMARAAVQAAARGGTGSFVGLFPVQGTQRWWDVAVTPIRDAAGLPESLLAVSRDITERFEADARIKEDRRVLELLNQTGAALASTLDLQDLLQKITDAATELSGAQFGAFFYNVISEDGEAYMLYSLSGAPRETFERLGFERLGKPRATPVFAPTFRGEGIIRCDDIRADPRYGRMAPHHGMPPGHLPVRSYLAVPVTSRSGDVIGGLFFGHPQPGVFTERSERLVAGVASQAAMAIDNARLYQAAQRAAEERKFFLESERSARSAAEHAVRVKDDFLATISHELRTPLSAILGWTQVLRLKQQASPEELRRGIDAIDRNARAQKQLIEDLLDMSRIASGKLRIDARPVDLRTVVEAAVDTVRPQAESKGVHLVTQIGPDPVVAHGDAARLQQVAWNLLANAVKFTPAAGTVTVALRERGGTLELTVADTGQGIAPEFVDHVFERFRQADSSATRTHGGLGLGLAIVRSIVELHGGGVSAASAGVGAGATFTVTLPAAGRAEHGGADARPAADFRIADFTGATVVVVDDQPDTREIVTRMLGECGATVVTAESAERALEILDSCVPDVLVTDISMPDMDGLMLLAKVRGSADASLNRVPAVALTAFARPEDRVRVQQAGFDAYVAKPLEATELVTAVARVLREPAPERAGHMSGNG